MADKGESCNQRVHYYDGTHIAHAERTLSYDSMSYLLCQQDGLTGSAWGDWANYTASPLRAFENELGVQEPVGFWDPAGFTADGSVENFKRRRQTELKHGRISMLATMGYITPEKLRLAVSAFQ